MENIYLNLKKNKVSISFTIIRYITNNELDCENECDYIAKTNLLECYYNYTEENGDWGSVGDVEISADELYELSNLLKKVLKKEICSFHFETQKPLFVLDISKINDRYSFYFKVADGLMPDTWIEVTFEELDIEGLTKYADVFLKWSEMFPVLSEEHLKEIEIIKW